MCVPSINAAQAIAEGNINMITCGGQSFLPLLYYISTATHAFTHVEVVSQIASSSAGMSTRMNIDDYMMTTEAAILQFTKARSSKVILNLNPAVPEVDMQTTVYVKYDAISFDLDELKKGLYAEIKKIVTYILGYSLLLDPVIKGSRVLVFSIKVRGCGDYLPEFAGNLDIINCAAIEVTRQYFETKAVRSSEFRV